MQMRDLPGEIEAEARAARLRLQAIEGLEHIFPLLRRTFVAHFDATALVDGDRDRAAAAAMVDGVAHQVRQRALDLRAIHLDMDLAGRRLEAEVVAGFDGQRREVGCHLAGKLAEIDDLALFVGALEQLMVEQLMRQAIWTKALPQGRPSAPI